MTRSALAAATSPLCEVMMPLTPISRARNAIPARSFPNPAITSMWTKALFVQTAARFKDTRIEIVKDGTVRDAKSMLGVLTLGVSQGTTIMVRADGPHADEAIAALSDLVDRDFGE